MKTQSNTNDIASSEYMPRDLMTNDIATAFEKAGQFKHFFQMNHWSNLNDLLTKLATPSGKKSFLVFKHNKYITIPTAAIALFYVKYESSVIRCFDGKEYSVNYSLDHIQHLLPHQQFFRTARQYLINFDAVKEVEHYFARKLLVTLTVPFAEKLLVSKEKVRQFLYWLENR